MVKVLPLALRCSRPRNAELRTDATVCRSAVRSSQRNLPVRTHTKRMPGSWSKSSHALSHSCRLLPMSRSVTSTAALQPPSRRAGRRPGRKQVGLLARSWSHSLLRARPRREPGGPPRQSPGADAGPEAARSDAALDRRWDELRQRAGLAVLRLHDLRHGCATFQFFAPGVPAQAIMDVLGHAAIGVTTNPCQDLKGRRPNHRGRVPAVKSAEQPTHLSCPDQARCRAAG